MLPLNQDVSKEPDYSSGFAPMLVDSHPRYVGAMRDGAVFVLIAMAINILASIAMFVGGLLLGVSDPFSAGPSAETYDMVETFHALTILVASAAGVLGWWWLTTRDPREGEYAEPSRSRPLVRTTLVVQTLAFLAMSTSPVLMGFLVPEDATPAQAQQMLALVGLISLTFGLAMLVKFFATMSYIRWLAPRIPDEILEEKAASFIFVGPVLVVGPMVGMFVVAFTGIVPMLLVFALLTVVCFLAALVKYWNLIYRTMAGLSAIAQEQRERAQLAAASRQNAA